MRVTPIVGRVVQRAGVGKPGGIDQRVAETAEVFSLSFSQFHGAKCNSVFRDEGTR